MRLNLFKLMEASYIEFWVSLSTCFWLIEEVLDPKMFYKYKFSNFHLFGQSK